jgi:hypothetical protein
MGNTWHDRAHPFSSNEVRLSIREWAGLLAILFLVGLLAGMVWNRLERFGPSAEYRIPYELSDDYWHFERFCDKAGESEKIFVIGDSFVWGQFVPKEQSLSSRLNQEAGEPLFVNTGLDGGHPLALEGLVRHHCGTLRNRGVILHLNLLWMSSPEADLQLERGARVNHPRLLPQFARRIPAYRASFEERIGVAAANIVPGLQWPRHLQSAYFSGTDPARWTLENPYENPIARVSLSLPEPGAGPRVGAEAWFVDGRGPQSPPWVDLEASLQWMAFKRLVEDLVARGNSVFVLVGPLNEHMLEPSSARRYRGLLDQAGEWLQNEGLPHFVAPLLPSHHYADLSHPLEPGYSFLARELWERLAR